MLVACATAASLFPFIGTIVYLIVRPPLYLEDVRERDLEIAAAQARLTQLEHQHCQFCGFETEKSFLRCPSCLRRLKEPCTVCGKPLDPRWKICPYCEAEVGQAAEGRRPRPRRAAAAAGRRAARPSAARPSGSPARAAFGRHGRAARSPEPRPPAVGRLAAPPHREGEAMDRTLILVKPDAFERGLTGEIIARFERKGLTIVAMKHMTVDGDLAEQHYAEHASARSSATSWSSSPAARSWRSCWRGTRA